MSKKKEHLKVVYVQIRADAETKKQELDEFVRYSGLNTEQFTVLNVFDNPIFKAEVMDGHDALFVGGSSDVTGLETVDNPEKYPFGVPLRKLFRHCIDNKIPVFASCYGFEELITEIGGQLVVDERNIHKGYADLKKTKAAQADLLFHDTPDLFTAVSLHKERAGTLPPDTIVLAETPTCPYAAIRLPGLPFYAFQFHPEINRFDLIERLKRYITRYHDDGADKALRTIVDNCPEVPEANKLVKKFVDRILLSQKE